jgi:hypothetical protein
MKKFLAIAASTVACAALLAISLPGKAEARRLYVGPRYAVHAFYHPDPGIPWYAVRAYYFGGPWSGVGGAGPYSWNGWPDYAAHNGIACVPGTIVKGGDGIWYACQ